MLKYMPSGGTVTFLRLAFREEIPSPGNRKKVKSLRKNYCFILRLLSKPTERFAYNDALPSCEYSPVIIRFVLPHHMNPESHIFGLSSLIGEIVFLIVNGHGSDGEVA